MAWLVAIIGSVTGFLFGCDEGIIAGSLELIRHYFNLTNTDVGLIASALPFGALIGSMCVGMVLASYFVKHCGRRSILFYTGILFLIGALGTAIATQEWMLVISRLVLGIAIGVAAVTTPLYLAETAPLQLRGAIVAIYQLAITIGIVCAYAANYLLIEHHAWRMMFASSAIPAVILVVAIFFLPESPRWLVSVNKPDAAADALRRLRRTLSIEKEIREIESTFANEPKGQQWQALFKKPLLPVLVLGMMLFCLQQLSGINVIIYFAPEIFKNLGFDQITGQMLATMGIGIVNLLITIAAVFFVDRLGRRKLLLIGFAGATISLAALSLFSYYHASLLAYLAVICLIMYIFSFAISIGPIPHIAMSEIFPLYVRGIGMGLSSLSNWGFNTLTVFSFPILHHAIGIESVFALYALICCGGFFYSYIYMPETKNLSLEAIEDYLVKGKALRSLGRDQPSKRFAAAKVDELLVG